MPTSLRDIYIVDGLTVIWYTLLFGLAGRVRHPQHAVVSKKLATGLGLYFHALGGDLKSKVADSPQEQSAITISSHGGVDLQAWVDGETLHLPRRINRYSSSNLNRELYYWLAAVLAVDEPYPKSSTLPPGVQHLLRGIRTTKRLLDAFPNLNNRYQRLCTEELKQRRMAYPDPKPGTRNPALVLESAIRYELGSEHPCQEESLVQLVERARVGESSNDKTPWHGRTVPFLPVPLWSYRSNRAPKFRLRWFKRQRNPQPELGDLESVQTGRFDADQIVEQIEGLAAIPDHYVYPEWNCFDQVYRRNWCRLMEQPPKGGYSADLDYRFAALVEKVRRKYMLVQQEPGWKRFLESGEEIDIDAVVGYVGDRKGCGVQNSRYYRERIRQQRDISVAVLMDASRSTQARVGNVRVIEIAKQSLAVLAEVLRCVGDDFALYSFSSDSRLRVRCDRIKTFEQPYDASIQKNILEVKPQYYTRIGAPIRHVGAKLAQRKTRQKLLLILTDGKPHDPTDRYEGKYALEDARRALMEQRANGIVCFGLTIDQEGPRYLNHLFGTGNYTIYSHLNAMPEVLPYLYAQLTNLRV